MRFIPFSQLSDREKEEIRRLEALPEDEREKIYAERDKRGKKDRKLWLQWAPDTLGTLDKLENFARDDLEQIIPVKLLEEREKEYGQYVAAKNNWRNSPHTQSMSDDEFGTLLKKYEKVSRPFGYLSKRWAQAGGEVGYDEYGNAYLDWAKTRKAGKKPIEILKIILPKGNVIAEVLPGPDLSDLPSRHEFYHLDTGNLTPQEYRQLLPHIYQMYKNKILGSNEARVRKQYSLENGKDFFFKPFSDSRRTDTGLGYRIGQAVRGIPVGLDSLIELGKMGLDAIGFNNDGNKLAHLLDYDEISKRYGEEIGNKYKDAMKNEQVVYNNWGVPMASADTVKKAEKTLGSLVGQGEVTGYLQQQEDKTSLTGLYDWMTVNLPKFWEKQGRLYAPMYNDVKGENMQTLGMLVNPFRVGASAVGKIAAGLGEKLGTKTLSKLGQKLPHGVPKKDIAAAAGIIYQGNKNRRLTPEEEENTEIRDLGLWDFISELAAGLTAGGLTSAASKSWANVSKKLTGSLSPEQYETVYNGIADLVKTEAGKEALKNQIKKMKPENVQLLRNMFPLSDIKAEIPADLSILNRLIKDLKFEDIALRDAQDPEVLNSANRLAWRYKNRVNDHIDHTINELQTQLNNKDLLVKKAPESTKQWFKDGNSGAFDGRIVYELANRDDLPQPKGSRKEPAGSRKDTEGAGIGELVESRKEVPDLQPVKETVFNELIKQKGKRGIAYNEIMDAINDTVGSGIGEPKGSRQELAKSRQEVFSPSVFERAKKALKDSIEIDSEGEGYLRRLLSNEEKFINNSVLNVPYRDALTIHRKLRGLGRMYRRNGKDAAAHVFDDIASSIYEELREKASSGDTTAMEVLRAQDLYHKMSKPIDALENVYEKVFGKELEELTQEQITKNLLKLDPTEKQTLLQYLPIEERGILRNIWRDELQNYALSEQGLRKLGTLSDKELQNVFANKASKFKTLFRDANVQNLIAPLISNDGKYTVSDILSMIKYGLKTNAPIDFIEELYGTVAPAIPKGQKEKLRKLIDFKNSGDAAQYKSDIWHGMMSGDYENVANKIKTPEDVKRLKTMLTGPEGAGIPEGTEALNFIQDIKIQSILKNVVNEAAITEGPRAGTFNISDLNKSLEKQMPLLKSLCTPELYANVAKYKDVINKTAGIWEKLMKKEKSLEKTASADTPLTIKEARNSFLGGILIHKIIETIIRTLTGGVVEKNGLVSSALGTAGWGLLSAWKRHRAQGILNKLRTDPMFAAKQIQKLDRSLTDTTKIIGEVLKDMQQSLRDRRQNPAMMRKNLKDLKSNLIKQALAVYSTTS